MPEIDIPAVHLRHAYSQVDHEYCADCIINMVPVPAFTCENGRYAYFYPRCASSALGVPEVVRRGYWEDSRPYEPSAHSRIFQSALWGDQFALQFAMRREDDILDDEYDDWARYLVGPAPPGIPSGLGPWLPGQPTFPESAWELVDPFLADSVPPGTYHFPDTILILLDIPRSDHDNQIAWIALQQQTLTLDLLAPPGSNSQVNQQRTLEQEQLAQILLPRFITQIGPQRLASWHMQYDLQNTLLASGYPRMREGLSVTEQEPQERHGRAPSVRTTTPSVDPSELETEVEELEQAIWVAQNIGENTSGFETSGAELEPEQEQEQEQLGWSSPSHQRTPSQQYSSARASSSPGLLYDSRASSNQSETASSWRPSRATTTDSETSTPTPTPRPAPSTPSRAPPRQTGTRPGAGTLVQSASGSRAISQSRALQGAAESEQSATRQSASSGSAPATAQPSSDPATQSPSRASSTPSREHLGRRAKKKIDYKQLNQRGMDDDQ